MPNEDDTLVKSLPVEDDGAGLEVDEESDDEAEGLENSAIPSEEGVAPSDTPGVDEDDKEEG